MTSCTANSAPTSSMATPGNDVLYGDNWGNPWGGEGNDLVYGGDGNDTIYGEGGSDTLYGEYGRDLDASAATATTSWEAGATTTS